ncbi:hypothetical protein GCM10023237_43730 [Streptomyces coeruleoprunus]
MYVALTAAACAVPVNANAAPPATAAATSAPIAFALPLVRRRCVTVPMRVPASPTGVGGDAAAR